jgi:hypothetical protein
MAENVAREKRAWRVGSRQLHGEAGKLLVRDGPQNRFHGRSSLVICYVDNREYHRPLLRKYHKCVPCLDGWSLESGQRMPAFLVIRNKCVIFSKKISLLLSSKTGSENIIPVDKETIVETHPAQLSPTLEKKNFRIYKVRNWVLLVKFQRIGW